MENKLKLSLLDLDMTIEPGKELWTALAYWDFDGTLANTPLPEPGKDLWSAYYNTPYPHAGWWGRLESMDLNVFDIKTKPEVHKMYDELNVGHNVLNFILTSRQPKFTPVIAQILENNNIVVEDVFTQLGNKTKGERILHHVKQCITHKYNITDVYFYDDRNKEIVTVEAVRSELEELGVRLHITKIESDAQD